jgi:hypothetical protein
MQDGDIAAPIGREVLTLLKVALINCLGLLVREQECSEPRWSYETDARTIRQTDKASIVTR